MKKSAAAGAIAALALCACATPAPPPAEAVLSYAPAAACGGAIAPAGALSLTPEKPAGMMVQSAPIGAASPCYTDANGQAAAYALFALPTSGDAASVNAGAVIEPRRLLAPRVMTLDANLAVVRTFATDDLQHRGRTYSVLFRPQAGEAYVAVATEGALVGGRFSFVTGDAASVPRPAYLSKNVSDEAYRDGLAPPFSYEGTAFARVYFNAPASAATP